MENVNWISLLVCAIAVHSSMGAPPPSNDLVPTPIPNQAATPYAAWTNGPSNQSDYFPIGVWLQNPARAPEYQAIGVNLYIGLWQGPTEAQLTALTAANMPVICDQNEYARTNLNNPIIVGWSQIDEPDNAQRFETFWQSDTNLINEAWPQYAGQNWGTWGPPAAPSQITNEYHDIKNYDDSRPVYLNLGQGVAWDEYIGRGVRTGHSEDYPNYSDGGDVVAFDIYPAVHSHPDITDALWRVPFGTQRLRGWNEEKPTWVNIECTRISNPTKKPTPAQVKSEVWMSIIFGARGIVYFCHQFGDEDTGIPFIEAALLADPEMMTAVSNINTQVQRLAPVLNSQSITGEVHVATSNTNTPISIMVKQDSDSIYIFSAAMHDEATTATFTLPNLRTPATVEVLGENRTVTAINGVFTDTFSPNDVHIYKAILKESGFIFRLK